MVCGHQNQLGIEKLPYQFYLKQKDNVQSIWAQIFKKRCQITIFRLIITLLIESCEEIYLENKSSTMPLHNFIPMHHSLGNF